MKNTHAVLIVITAQILMLLVIAVVYFCMYRFLNTPAWARTLVIGGGIPFSAVLGQRLWLKIRSKPLFPESGFVEQKVGPPK